MNKALYFLLISLCQSVSLHAQQVVTGFVQDPDKLPLSGANLELRNAGFRSKTAADGRFEIVLTGKLDSLKVSFVGYITSTLAVYPGMKRPLTIILEPESGLLDEVLINTGYYQVPKERATGSFTHIDNSLFNRSVSTNILDRLEGVTNGLLFDRRNLEGEDINGSPELRVRGLSTIEANSSPLIVVDNFPYEGDISSINPNNVESVTVLRDAAATSIWGARAGNGVIVINTKQGSYNQAATISFNSNVTIGEKPDLFYNQNVLPSATVMEIQKELFNRHAYQERNQTNIPIYYELLIKQRDHLITAEEFNRQEAIFRNSDIRRDASKYLYQESVNQQYALSVSGGGGQYRYYIAAGYDRDRSFHVGDDNDRKNISLQNTFKPHPNLELSGGITYAIQRADQNAVPLTDIGVGNNSMNPYASLIDGNGNPLAVTRSNLRYAYQEQADANGLLDWMYRPIDEQRLSDKSTSSEEMRINTSVKYTFLRHLNIQGTYQYIKGNSQGRNYYAPETFFVRDMVNRYTQSDGTQIIPNGGILDLLNPVKNENHAGRIQGNYQQKIAKDHEISLLAGAEIRQGKAANSPSNRIYNFDPEHPAGLSVLDYTTRHPTRPNGSKTIEFLEWISSQSNSRDLSYFGNTSYTYQEKYIFSGSIRWDGSNLLGVKTNQRGTALWSVGGSWEASKEGFYGLSGSIPYLRLRMTYGSSGLIDKTQSTYPVIALSTDPDTGLTYADVQQPGNPALRWEQVNTFNIGIDWKISNNRITGSVEIYNKAASHLLTDKLMDPTAGVGKTFKSNYANLRTRGLDIQVNSRNLTGPVSWESGLILNYSGNKVTQVNGPGYPSVSQYMNYRVPVTGYSIDQVYSIPWNGLNQDTGQPLIYIDGQISDEYKTYYNSLEYTNLVRSGTNVAPWFGSIMNTFTYKGLQISMLLNMKFGRVFRRKSMLPGGEYYLPANMFHMDYFKRWQEPGDEQHTSVPAYAESINEQRNWIYRYSEALITPGGVIRLQDINLNYTFAKKMASSLGFQSIRIYAYLRNIGILWKANKDGLDPDYPSANYPAPKSCALGLQIDF